MLSKTTPKAHSCRILTKSAAADKVVQICRVSSVSRLLLPSAHPGQQFVLDLSRANSAVLRLLLIMQPARGSSMFRKTKHGLITYLATPHFKATTQMHTTQAATHERHVGRSHAMPCQQRPAWHAFETRPTCSLPLNDAGAGLVLSGLVKHSRVADLTRPRRFGRGRCGCLPANLVTTAVLHIHSMTVSTTKLPGTVVHSALGRTTSRLCCLGFRNGNWM
ncbi:hypothetical protein QBC40DRAFT_20873 [Triangularia verruculosa]|uniref:Uncharacterized protein n=1 Tax=Triangularia verruculosa TaxID=2587418 RepID=A0AAN6XQJ2_9PEZI|nr:hypothetical protein QBC40DRAFT_20873 [Triangularia verruculosa]